MEANDQGTTSLMLPRLGAAIIVTAIVSPALTLPLTLGCLIGLAYCAANYDRPAAVQPSAAPQEDSLPPSRRPRQGNRNVTGASEDSFPASDPPAWTPVTGTGTRH